jgi:gas vesicle protein
MNKLLVGLIVGALLGAVDGLTAWFTPQVRDQIIDIVMWSTLKGVIAGIAAGWYAKKVHSVPKGIAFGFIVGLVLAFLVAMMPDPKTGAHYWWQIMVPGSLLGGVIGWATQRYGRPSSSRGAASAMAMIGLCLFGFNAYGHHDDAKVSANAAFEKIKTLAGLHHANQMTADGPTTKVEYKISANGTAIFETMFGGEPHEMITVYTVDGDSVMATHFCSGGNQPVMRLNAAKSNEHELVFDFERITGAVTPNHINGVTFTFGDDGKVEESWSSKDSEHVRLFYTDAK